jgi:hypothetical protein
VPKGIMVVWSAPSDPAREDEFNEWYGRTHLPELLAVPGFVSARRYKAHDAGGSAAPSAHPYLAIYEIEADDLTGPVKELRARSVSGQTTTTDVLQTDPPPVVTLYELIE